MGLTPQYLDRVPESMEKLYEGVEMDILRDMARRINTYDFFIPAAEHQYKMLEEMGLLQREILLRLSDISGQSEETLQRLMTEAGATSLQADDVIHRRAGKKLSPLTASVPLQQTLRAGLANTNMRFTNLTRTTATMAAKQFGDVLDLAHMQIITGAFDVDTAIRNSIKELSRQGVKAVQYASGRVETLEVAVRRATLTGVSQTVGKLQEARAIEAGCNLVEVTAHAGARPDHAEWQGKVYALEGHTEKYKNLAEATGYGTGAGLMGWNCRHDFFPFYEGISAPAYSKEMLEKYETKTYEYQGKKMTEYEAVQHQRYLERGIRRWKREFVLADGAGIDSTEAASKLRTWREAQKDFLRKTGLKVDSGRTGIVGFDNSTALFATRDAERYYKRWIEGITYQGAPINLAKYYDIKYNDIKTFELLQGYARAVKIGDISPLVGFDKYLDAASEIDKELIGLTIEGVTVQRYSTHFIDRVIGQVSEAHPGRRAGTPIPDVKNTLLDPRSTSEPYQRLKADGSVDIRINVIGENCSVAISVTDKKFIQTNPL